MWTPTHVQVTVQRAKGLLVKGKGTNDAFVTISLGKEKYQTSTKDKATDPVEWHEECELPIPRQGNKADIVLTVLHRNFIGDEFLGQVSIPLAEFDVYDKPKNKWYELKSKPGQEKKNKYRGEIEVKVNFTVQSGVSSAASLADLKKKDGIRGSFGTLSQKMGGSLLSLGKEKKSSIKNLAKAVGSKVSTLPGRGRKKNKDDSFGSIPEQSSVSGLVFQKVQRNSEADPGVISDDDDEFRLDALSNKSSHSSLSVSQVALSASTPQDGSLENLGGGEFLRRNYATPPPSKPQKVEPKVNNKTQQQRWSSGPVDDWESKLFGKKYSFETTDEQKVEEPSFPQLDTKSKKMSSEKLDPPSSIQPPAVQEPSSPSSAKSKKSSGSVPSSPVIKNKELNKEPVPKPRQAVTAPKPEESAPPQKTPAPPVPEQINTQQNMNNKNKESIRASVKESLASIFGNSHKQEDNETNPRGAPVAVTNPIRMKDPQNDHRLPRDILKKYETKTREDLIEIVINQQATLEYQKQKLSDMEDYIDNLVARVIETHPTLLQSPFVTRHTLK